MSTYHNPIKLYETVVDECPYLDEQQSSSVLVDPDHPVDKNLYSLLSRSGFRRSGEMLYAPKCPTCNACVSVRIPADKFKASRGQKRIWRKNMDIKAKIENAGFRQTHFELYMRYQRARHPNSSMCDDDPKKYTGFIKSSFAKSKFLCFYHKDKLICIAVLDQFQGGLSAVYTFFDPDYADRSLGTYAILYMVKLSRMNRIPYVYLGYWIEKSQKMRYKQQFQPLEGFIEQRWQAIEKS